MYANYTQDLILQKYRWVSTQMSGMWRGLDPTPLCSSPSVLQIYLVFNWSILNNNVKTHLFFEFHFAAFPGKTAILSITGKSLATLILAGRHS